MCLLVLAIFALSFNSSAQKEIRPGYYLYGNLQNSVRGNILVVYKILDPASENILIDRLERSNRPFLNYHDYFFPETHYEPSEIDSFLKEKQIESIVYVNLKDVTTSTLTTGTSFYSDLLKTAFSFSSRYKMVEGLTLFFEIRNVKDGFKRPVAMLQASGTSNWSKDFEGTLAKSIRQIVKCLDEEGGFDGEIKRPLQVDMNREMDKYINR